MFSADWLELRRAADDAARNVAVRDAVARKFAGRPSLRIADLASGTGANIRALSPFLGTVQHWSSIDHNAELLSDARTRFQLWADGCETDGGAIRLSKAESRIEVVQREGDLAANPAPHLSGSFDLVTASAFLDLVSVDWIEKFAAALAALRLPLYATLTYTGEERWRPPHSSDAKILAAFASHQTSDKGFGRAAGAGAGRMAIESLKRRGYHITEGDSSWRLRPEQRPLMTELLDGIVLAVAETGLIAPGELSDWHAARKSSSECVIGHIDFFAMPPDP